MRALLLAYVVTLPLVQASFFRLPLGKALVPSDLVFLALVVAIGANPARWRWPPMRLCILATLPPTAMVLSAFLTATPRSSAVPETLRTAYSMAVLLLMAGLPRDEKLERDVARTWCATSILVCTIGVAAYVAVTLLGVPENALARANSTNLGPGVVRISGVLPTNSLTLYLVISSAFALGLVEHGQTLRDRVLGRGALAAAITVSAVSLSRGLLGLVVFLAIAAFRRDAPSNPLAAWRWPMAVAAFLLAGLTVVATWWAVFPLERVAGGWAPNRQPNGNRVLHVAGLRMFASHPITGVGPGNFGGRLAAFSTPKEREASWPPVPSNRRWISHSSWVGFVAEGGLPLLGAWMAVLGFTIQQLLKCPPHSFGPLVGIALTGIALNGFHVNFEHLKFIWAAAGLALGGQYASARARVQ